MIERGILYIVSGDEEIIKECIHSAYTVKKYDPSLPIQVISERRNRAFTPKLFDFVDVFEREIHPLKAKVILQERSRFQLTLFLDADTEVRDGFSEIFKEAESADLCFSRDNLCDWSTNPIRFLAQESEDINTGLLLYKRTSAVTRMFREWVTAMEKQDESQMRPGYNCDQQYFNRLFRERCLAGEFGTTRVLDNRIYNVRPWCWDHLKQTGKFENARILHAHHLHHGFFAKLKRKLFA